MGGRGLVVPAFDHGPHVGPQDAPGRVDITRKPNRCRMPTGGQSARHTSPGSDAEGEWFPGVGEYGVGSAGRDRSKWAVYGAEDEPAT